MALPWHQYVCLRNSKYGIGLKGISPTHPGALSAIEFRITGGPSTYSSRGQRQKACMPIQLICWNMQKINKGNAEAKASLMLSAIEKAKGFDINKPWALAILECKGDGKTVGEAIRFKLKGAASCSIDAEGGAHTKEHVVLIWGGGCKPSGGVAHTDWQTHFDTKLSTTKTSFDLAQSLNRHSPRDAVVASSSASKNQALDDVWSAENCRNPVLVQFTAGADSIKVAFVHSPGPSAKHALGKNAEYAKTFFSSISRSLAEAGIDIVMGDFNIYSEEDLEPDPAWDLTLLENSLAGPGTTYKSSGERSSSQLDRVFMSSEFVFGSNVSLLDGKIEASDHLGVFVDVRRASLGNGALPASAATLV